MKHVILITNKWTGTESLYPQIFKTYQEADKKIEAIKTENNNYKGMYLEDYNTGGSDEYRMVGGSSWGSR